MTFITFMLIRIHGLQMLVLALFRKVLVRPCFECLSSALLEKPQFGLASKVSVRPFLIRWRGFVNCVDTSNWFVRRRRRQVIVTPMFGFPDADGRGQDVVRRRHGDRNPGVDFGVACACREDLPDWRTVKKVSDALLVARLWTDMKNSLS